MLVPGLRYENLEISDGQTASVYYINALKNPNSVERNRTFYNLRKYCELDTLAMVLLHQVLEGFVL